MLYNASLVNEWDEKSPKSSSSSEMVKLLAAGGGWAAGHWVVVAIACPSFAGSPITTTSSAARELSLTASHLAFHPSPSPSIATLANALHVAAQLGTSGTPMYEN